MLTFSLKKEWYEKIKCGKKTVEYREVRPYWDKRFAKEFCSLDVLVCGEKSGSNFFVLHPHPCVLRLGYTKQCMTAKIVKVEWLETGKHTDLAIDAPVYALRLADVREAGSGGGKRMKTRRHNWLFKEWYWGSGCGEQNLCGKTEPEKIEAAFVKGMKVAHAAMSVGMKSAFAVLFRKDDAWK